MDKFANDAGTLALQHKLADLRADFAEAERTGCSDQLLLQIMDEQDAITADLLRRGCHLRDCN